MSAVTPQVLTSIASAGYSSTYYYKHKSSITGYEIYGMAYLSNNTFVHERYDIKVDTSTNTWIDHGDGNPFQVLEVGFDIELREDVPGSNLLYKFTKPTSASWISSGGGLGTLSDTPSGSLLYDLTNSKITWSINTSSPSTASDAYAIVWAQSGSATNNYSLNYPTVSSADITSPDPLSGTWQLTHFNTSSTSNPTTILDELTIGSDLQLVTTQRKVFCNFW